MPISADQARVEQVFPWSFLPSNFSSNGISVSLYGASFQTPTAQIHMCMQTVINHNLYHTELGIPVKACDKVYTQNLNNSLYY